MTAQTLTILSFLASILLLISSIAYAFYVGRKYKKKQSPSDNAVSHALQDQTALVIEEARKKAERILLDAEYIKKDLVEELDSNLQRIAATSIKQLEQETAAYHQQHAQLFAKMDVEHDKLLDEIRSSLEELKTLKKELLKEFESSLKQTSEEIANELKLESGEYKKQFHELLDSTKAEFLRKAEESVAAIEKIPQEEIESFKEILRSETIESQKIIGKRVNEEFNEVQKEIQEYKDQKFEDMDESVQEVIKKVTKEVLSKSLSDEDHRKLVLEALQEAKTEDSFVQTEALPTTQK